jgi:FMN phosphatase YigB (HAD superfamily)
MLDLSSVDLILWDVDGVLYVRDMAIRDVSKIHTLFGKEICKFIPGISEKEGVEIIFNYFAKNPAKFYDNIEMDYNINIYDLEHKFHEIMLEFYDYKNFDYIEQEYIDKFNSINSNNIALTQANKVWADKILEKTHLLDSINKVICSEVTLKTPKNEYNNLYLDICNEMNVAPERAVMIEDSHRNLKAAKKHGLQTVLFNYDKEINEDYIDYQYRDIRDFLSKI